MVVEKQAAVGWRVRVFWEGDDAWFEGVVKKYSPESGYYVEYDDGEEQWEVEDPAIFEFLSKPNVSPSLEHAQLILAAEEEEDNREEGGDNGVQGREKWSAQPPPSTAGDAEDEYGEDDYEEDHEQDDESAEDHSDGPNDGADSPTPESVTPVKQPPSKQPSGSSKQPRDPAKYTKSGVFFRDAETLCATKTALQKESQELEAQYDRLVTQLQQKELQSASVKRELHGLKAQVSLSSLTGKGSNSSRGQRKNTKDWTQLLLEQKTANRTARQELSGLQTQISQTNSAIQQMEKQKEQLQTRLDRVPRKELCSLVDVEVEIAQLMNDKRSLEAQLAKTITPVTKPITKAREGGKPGNVLVQADVKTELEQELRKTERVVSRVSDEVDQWRLSYEKENARIQPLKARLDTLQRELARYESSQVLLRSVFLRLDRDGTGQIPVDAAVDALTLLASQSQTKPREEIQRTVTASRSKDVDSTGGMDFVGFTRCFDLIFPKVVEKTG